MSPQCAFVGGSGRHVYGVPPLIELAWSTMPYMYHIPALPFHMHTEIETQVSSVSGLSTSMYMCTDRPVFFS